jgi:polysaccharide chain length determinant protein (PEP-CTERM system associated)
VAGRHFVYPAGVVLDNEIPQSGSDQSGSDMDRLYVLTRQVLTSAWRQRWLLVATSWALCVIGWAGVYLVPNVYESEARLYVDADAILTPLLRGLAIDTATANQLELMQRTLLSRPNLDKLIGATDLNLSATVPQQKERLISQLGRAIKVTSEARNLFTVTYRNENPQLAHDVVAGLVDIFLEQATGSNRADMANAQKFLTQQISSYEIQLRAAEQRRADFRRKYLDILPLESNGGSRLDNARVSVRDLEAQVRDALANRAALQEEARITPPVISAASVGGGVAGETSSHDQLALAEAKLAELRTRFTDQHPDVILTRQLIASLAAAPNRTGSASTYSNRGSLANPVYEQVKLRLIEAEATVSSLQARLDTARKELTRMEELARVAPQVEAEYQDLDRGYNVLRKNYEELLARRESSNITAAADTGADKVRLRVIDPPQMPSIPIAPNRLMLISIVLLGGLGAAAALPIVLSQMDQSISDVGRLRELGPPVLGGISLVPSSTRRIKLYSLGLTVAASIVLLLVVYGGLASRMITHNKVLF